MKPNVLVTGGAGYIGSHVVRELLAANYGVRILDNLSEGHRKAVPERLLHIGDISDQTLVATLIQEHDINAVLHFAGRTLVEESVREPRRYFQHNTFKTNRLIETLIDCKVPHMVFSSTAAVYGEPVSIPISETDPQVPTNAYGESKLMIERMMKHYDRAYGFRYISLRYFNACGANSRGDIGEAHHPETHLIPVVLQVALGQREKIMVFGDDYDTKDGTCLRDYIHVDDLATAHIRALEALLDGSQSRTYNLGNGEGHTVQEVITAARSVTEHPIPAEVVGRRPGDPAKLVASSVEIIRELGWQPKYPGLHSIVGSAWKWHRDHPNGYEG